jgi:Dyp-type peroxidase family
LIDNALKINDPSASGSDLLGARLVGRWKSGAPVQLSPLRDNPKLAVDPQHNNSFTYTTADVCPFAAHTRKMNPRGDIPVTAIATHRVIRRGIQYGPEVGPNEKVTRKDRGLLFVSYQADLSKGFQFLQKSWANNLNFPPKPNPGIDPIIGQGTRTMTGANPENVTASLDLVREWVISKGGEYFFAPSITALRGFDKSIHLDL